ncbi:MAG: lamin tail domain-containing protein, partial [bacterium]
MKTMFRLAALCLFAAIVLAPQQLHAGGSILISEIMYNPVAATNAPIDGDEYEYIEIYNPSAASISLTGVYLTNGVNFSFPPGRTLNPGSYLVVVRNLSAFTNRYPGVTNVLGSYIGKLANNGDTLKLKNAAAEDLFSVNYGDGPKWPQAADGHGASLVLYAAAGNPDDPLTWRASDEFKGSPGRAGLPAVRDVVINEILAHTDPPLEDTVELHNVTTNAVNIRGWYLSDDPAVPKKYRITNAVLQAGGYAVFRQSQYGKTNDPLTTPFLLSELGDSVYLTAADLRSNVTRAVDFAVFGVSSNGMSFGRYPDGTGNFTAMAQRTLGGSNGLPRIGPVVVSEIMYHPPTDDPQAEYVELLNIASFTVPLFDPEFPTNTWRLTSAMSFVFPTNVTMPPGGRIVVTGATNLPAFRALYGLSVDMPVYGSWSGRLDNAGECVQLEAPTHPETNLVPFVVIEGIDYDGKAPWPTAPDGQGPSLERLDPAAFGNKVSNWFAGPPGGSPGRAPPGGFVNQTLWPMSPVPGSIFTATVSIVAAAMPTQVLFRTMIDGTETALLMHDDGVNGDRVAGDLVYSTIVNSPAVGSWLYYRFEASSPDGQSWALPAETGSFLPSPLLTVRMSGGGLLTNVQPTEAWTTYTYSDLATHSNLVYIYLNSAGEALFDDFTLKDQSSQVQHAVNGDFATSFGGWSVTGNHSGTFREELQEENGNGVMHLVASGANGGSSNTACTLLNPPLTPGQGATLGFRTRCAGTTVPRWFWVAAGTPPVDVIVNEIMYHPADTNEATLEYVELYNPAATAASLGGAQLEGVGFAFPAGTTLEPHAYL